MDYFPPVDWPVLVGVFVLCLLIILAAPSVYGDRINRL